MRVWNPVAVFYSEIVFSFGGQELFYGMKKCHRCKLDKNLDEFPVNRTKDDGRSETCLVCKREYNKKHYTANKQYYIDKAQKHKEEIRSWLAKCKSQMKCQKCEQDHPATLQFHHNDPSQKEFEISLAVGRAWSLERIKQEIEKCSVLCANCHLILHWEERMSDECGGSTQASEA